VTGAYRFLIKPGTTQMMDVDAALYPRKPIERVGIAPLTSMFLYAENDKRISNDWRPEIHDSDGLAMWTGHGEWIWRPLVNPAHLRFNAYADNNPRGFGLMQRDRDFDHYQDDGVFYDRRPSLWVEPKSGWGKGSIQLVEIPTVDETFDNIVAFWNPEAKPQPGTGTAVRLQAVLGRDDAGRAETGDGSRDTHRHRGRGRQAAHVFLVAFRHRFRRRQTGLTGQGCKSGAGDFGNAGLGRNTVRPAAK
jgi:glucan biosynthesis protein